MAQSINDLERDIAESRARLDLTIDRIQDKLSVSGILDDVLGQMRKNQYASTYESALEVIRRNPVPVMLVAAGIGWLLHRAGRERASARMAAPPVPRTAPVRRTASAPETTFRPYDDAEMPAVNHGSPRVYGADPVALDPLPDTFGTGRDPGVSGSAADPLDTRRDPIAPLTATGLGPRM